MIRAGALGRHTATVLFSAVDRREAWLWILAIFVVSTVALRSVDGTMAGLMRAFGDHNLIYWFCYAVIARSIAGSAALPIDRISVVALFGGALSLFVVGVATNVPALDGIIATGLGAVLYWKYSDDPGLRRASILMLALGVNLFWAQVVFALLKEQIVTLDAGLAEVMLRVAGYEVERTINTVSTGSGFKISIIGECSAFNNLSLAILAALAAIIGVRGSLRRDDIIGILIVCVVLIAFNTVRLSVFASSHSAYEYWHEGEGAPVLAILQIVLTLGAAAAISLRTRHRFA